MTSKEVNNARYHARDAIEKARKEAQSARARADWIRDSGYYAPEGVEEFVGERVGQAKKITGSSLKTADSQAAKAREATERALREARTVPAEERAIAAAILGPAISAATTNDPKGLIELYRNRAPQSQADRFILEEAVQAVIDAGLGDLAFAETWSRTRNALADQVETPEERAAMDDLDALAGLEGYVAHARRVVEGDLATAETGSPEAFTVANETSRFVVDHYERGLEDGTLDDPVEHTPQDVSGVPTEGAAITAGVGSGGE